MPFHSTAMIFRVVLAPSFEKSALKNPCVSRVADIKEVDRCSFRQLWKTLIVGLLPMIRPMTILRAFLATLSCISTTIFDENSTSSFKLLSTSDGPWDSFEGEAILNPLPGGVLSGGMYGAGVEAVVFFFLCVLRA